MKTKTQKQTKPLRHTETRMVEAHLRYAEQHGIEIYNLGKGMTHCGIFSTTDAGGLETYWDSKKKQYIHELD